jgi:hypothetical protein
MGDFTHSPDLRLLHCHTSEAVAQIGEICTEYPIHLQRLYTFLRVSIKVIEISTSCRRENSNCSPADVHGDFAYGKDFHLVLQKGFNPHIYITGLHFYGDFTHSAVIG